MQRDQKRAEILIEKKLNEKWFASGTLYPDNPKYSDSIFCPGIGDEYGSIEDTKDVVMKFCKDKYDIPVDAISFDIG